MKLTSCRPSTFDTYSQSQCGQLTHYLTMQTSRREGMPLVRDGEGA
jgi:hypothetical protein